MKCRAGLQLCFGEVRRKESAASMIEFLIAVPVLALAVLGMIDLFTYLYLRNVLEARAHRAVEVASWMPHISEPERTDNENAERSPQFAEALANIESAAVGDEVSQLFSTGSAGRYRARLESEPITILEKDIESSEVETESPFDGGLTNSVAVLLPTVDAVTGSRDRGFERQPIGIRINAKLNPLTPFLPAIDVSGVAWGYRENISASSSLPMFDCLGRPFNPNRLPTPEDCDCGEGGMNPLTGQCGCPDGKIWGQRPGSSTFECICDVSKLSCEPGQLYNYDTCECGAMCPVGSNPLFGQRRSDDNTCECTVLPGAVKESEDCRNVCTTVAGVTTCRAVTSGCSNSNCFSGTHWSPTYCGCWCAPRNSLIGIAQNQPPGGPLLYQYYAQGGVRGATFTDPETACQAPVCDQTGVMPGFHRTGPHCLCASNTGQPTRYVDDNGFILQINKNCQYECVGRTWGGRHQVVDGRCVCRNGYVSAGNVFNANAPVDCCPANKCTGPHEEVYVTNNSRNQRDCLCRCLPGYIRDPNTNECVSDTETEREGIS